MKALVKYKHGSEGVELREIEKPSPKSDELLIRVLAVGICGTDIHIMHDEYPCRTPVVLGHEFTGIVTQIGSNVREFEVGDQVISSTAAVTCERCDYCRQGLRMLCEHRESIGSGNNGAMSDFLVVPAKLAYVVPDSYKGEEVVAIAEPLACAVRAVIEQSLIKSGDIVLISGPGTIGLGVTQIAKTAGAYVIVIGTKGDEKRLESAVELGADFTCTQPSELKSFINKNAPNGVDVAYECAGVTPSFDTCLEFVRKGGNLAQVGLFGKPVKIDMDKLLCKEIRLTVSYASEPSSWDILMKLMTYGHLDFHKMVSDIYPLEEWQKAFNKFMNREGLKILIRP